MLIVQNLTNNLRTRPATLNGREFLVAPVTMLVEGVLNGNKGPLFYPKNEIARNYHQWNGMPLTLGHPRLTSARTPQVLEQTGLGYVYNARIRDGKLVAEAWIDVEKTKQISPEILQRIENNDPVDISTGLFTKNTPKTGVSNGRKYVAVATAYVPDHLAILPNEKGACSTTDGCGILVNADGNTNDSFYQEIVVNRINKIKGKYFVVSEEGKRLGGPYDTEEEAKKRLRQVEFHKRRKDNASSISTLGGTVDQAEENYSCEDGCGPTCECEDCKKKHRTTKNSRRIRRKEMPCPVMNSEPRCPIRPCPVTNAGDGFQTENASGCGAGKPGLRGFQEGNTCGKLIGSGVGSGATKRSIGKEIDDNMNAFEKARKPKPAVGKVKGLESKLNEVFEGKITLKHDPTFDVHQVLHDEKGDLDLFVEEVDGQISIGDYDGMDFRGEEDVMAVIAEKVGMKSARMSQ